jgi:cation transport ATPase
LTGHETYFATVAQVTPVVLLTVLLENKVFEERQGGLERTKHGSGRRAKDRHKQEREEQEEERHKHAFWLATAAVVGTGLLILCEILCIQALYANVDSAWTRIVVGMCLLFGGLLGVYTPVWRYVLSLKDHKERWGLGTVVVVCSVLAIGVSVVLFWDQYQHSWWRL